MIAWYLCPYNHVKGGVAGAVATRRCAMSDFSKEIRSSGGIWNAIEVADNQAIVKVDAPEAMLNTFDLKFKRFPDDFMNSAEKDIYLRPPRKPRYDAINDKIICDGEVMGLNSIDLLNERVK